MSALLRLSWASLSNRRFTAAVTVATIALSVLLLLGVERLRQQARDSFLRSVAGTDLIVAARGHPVQILLHSVFHLGDATHAVQWSSYQQIAARPEVAWAVPVSLGDAFRGHRVVGTTPGFFEHVRTGGQRPLRFTQGQAFDGLFEAVLGAEVAARLGNAHDDHDHDHGDAHGEQHAGDEHATDGPAREGALGAEIVLAHGSGGFSRHDHDDRPFRVVGVLARTGTPIDHAVFISLESQQAIHLNWRSGTRIGVAPTELTPAQVQPRSITAFFLGLNSPAATFALQRAVNEFEPEPLSAVLPGVALQQLWSMLGLVERALLVTAACVVAAGLLGMLAALLGTLSERRREMAILRALGAGPGTVALLLVLEALLLTALGLALGVGLLQLLSALAAPAIEAASGIVLTAGWPSASEWKLLGLVLCAGAAVSLIPAFLAYRRSLADGMMVRN
jgi:putative ABC transport system permease protein